MKYSLRNIGKSILTAGLVALASACSTPNSSSTSRSVKEFYPMQPQVKLENKSDNSKREFNVPSFKKADDVYLVESNSLPNTDNYEAPFVLRVLDSTEIRENDRTGRFALDSPVFVGMPLTNYVSMLPRQGVILDTTGAEGYKAERKVIRNKRKSEGYELGDKIEISFSSALRRLSFDGKTFILPLSSTTNKSEVLGFVGVEDKNRVYHTNGAVEVRPGLVYGFFHDPNYDLRVPKTNSAPQTTGGQVIRFSN